MIHSRYHYTPQVIPHPVRIIAPVVLAIVSVAVVYAVVVQLSRNHDSGSTYVGKFG